MPHLVRLFVRQGLIGFALSAVFVSALLYLNVANLWHLVTTSDLGWVAVMMLFYFNGIVFAGVQIGIKVMSMAENEDPTGGGKKQRRRGPAPMPHLATLPVENEKWRAHRNR